MSVIDCRQISFFMLYGSTIAATLATEISRIFWLNEVSLFVRSRIPGCQIAAQGVKLLACTVVSTVFCVTWNTSVKWCLSTLFRVSVMPGKNQAICAKLLALRARSVIVRGQALAW